MTIRLRKPRGVSHSASRLVVASERRKDSKNFLFLGADSGGERAATMYSLIVSAKLNEAGIAGASAKNHRPISAPKTIVWRMPIADKVNDGTVVTLTDISVSDFFGKPP
jgi:hypothetical protein